jgi:hypothetical protein
MVEDNPPASCDGTCTPSIFLPIALYVSGELIFELYDGGQPSRRFSIRWERFVPGKESEPHTPRLVPAFHDPPNADFQRLPMVEK